VKTVVYPPAVCWSWWRRVVVAPGVEFVLELI
jgi:hypothetical protein